MNAKTAADRLRYSKRFYSLLQNGGDAQVLMQLSPDKRIHVMKALSNLADFTGTRQYWKELRERYNLRWSIGTEKLDVFERFFYDDGKTLDKMLEQLKEAIHQLPKAFSNLLLFCTLTGLRCIECVSCIRLIKDSETFKTYYNESRQCLEHFRFPKVFLRRTKSAYISLVDNEILQIAQDIDKTPTYTSLKMASRRRSLSMNLKYCRKIYASYLRQNGGIESEIVDLLQGRVPKSVFARHYFRPSADYKDRVMAALKALKQKILY